MWYMSKNKPKNEQTYEQIKRAITTSPFRKRLMSRTTVEKSVVNARSKPSKDNDPTSNSLRDLRQLEKENRILPTLGDKV